jgi:hypothetical protein
VAKIVPPEKFRIPNSSLTLHSVGRRGLLRIYVKEASAMKYTPDEDAPELTLEQYVEMAELAKERR